MLKVAHYIELLDSSAASLPVPECYQQLFPGETRNFNGKSWQFSPFSIAGDVSTDGGEAGDHELIAPANIISISKLWQASGNRQFIRILTVLLAGTPPSDNTGIPEWTEVSLLSSSIYACGAMGYSDSADDMGEAGDDFAPVTLALVNPLNFVSGTSPTRRLTAAQVGPLPSSGGIAF
jgi:hypothetical protein